MVGVSTSRRDQGVGRPAPGCPGEALSPDRAALSVLAGGGMVTIRGEVRSLDQISRASRVIDGFGGDTEIVNLVRLPAADELKRPVDQDAVPVGCPFRLHRQRSGEAALVVGPHA